MFRAALLGSGEVGSWQLTNMEGVVPPPDYSSFGLKDKIAIVTGASQGDRPRHRAGPRACGAHPRSPSILKGGMMRSSRSSPRSRRSARRAIVIPTDVEKADVRAMVARTRRRSPDRHPGEQRGMDGKLLALDVTEEEFDKTISAQLKSVFALRRRRG